MTEISNQALESTDGLLWFQLRIPTSKFRILRVLCLRHTKQIEFEGAPVGIVEVNTPYDK